MIESNMTTFYILRHGESEGNAKGDIEAGFTDWPLTEQGREDARIVRKRLQSVPFDAAFSSTMRRAQETAKIIMEGKDLPVSIIENIHESSLGKYAESRPELTKAEIMEQMSHDLSMLDHQGKMAYKHGVDMESDDDIALRLTTALHKIESTHPQEVILLVNHGNVMRSFLKSTGFATYDELPKGSIENTGYAVVKSDGKSFSVAETHRINKGRLQ